MLMQVDQISENLKGIQKDFSGGMNLFPDDTKIGDNEYRECFNARNRSGNIEPIIAPILLENAPVGKKQGIYGFDTFFVMFNDGQAYFQVIGTTTWVKIATFQMSATADFIYAEAVPASTFNVNVVLRDASNSEGTNLNTAINVTNTSINGTVAGLVCQDGINQPWIISADKVARVIQTYDQWTMDKREYVPIGKQMKFINGILIVVSPDGKQLLRSVTERPIDFVVNIDTQGNKGGDAYTTAYAVSYNPITGIAAMNSGQLFVGTALGCFPVTFVFDKLIFGEPTFSNAEGIAAGMVNQNSFVDILGDYAFIDFNGLRSFNAVKQLQNEGRNSVFSLKIQRILQNIVQDITFTCSAVFDNYALFSVKTIYGYAFVVYDTLNQVWVSIDITPVPIKMLAVTTLQTNPRLFGISEDSIYEFFSPEGTERKRVFFRTQAFISGDCEIEMKPVNVRCAFYKSNTEDDAVVTMFCDDKKSGKPVRLPLSITTGGIEYPAEYPVLFNNRKRVNNLKFEDSQDSEQCYKVAAGITWHNKAQLTQVQVEAQSVSAETSLGQQAQTYAN